MVRAEVIRKRLNKLDEYLAILYRLQEYTLDEFICGPEHYGSAERFLQLGIETITDMGNHVIAELALGVVNSYGDIPTIMSEQGYIDASLKEKWIRVVVDARRIALLANPKENGQIKGMISIENLEWPSELSQGIAAPHVSLVKIQGILTENSVALFAAPSGDLFIMSGKDIVFQKTQGYWRFHNYKKLHMMLLHYIKDKYVARDVLRSILDLSYERKGALFCVVDARKVSKIIDQQPNKLRVNEVLQNALKGKEIKRINARRVISSAACTDGAVVLDKSGKVHGVACMINPISKTEYGELDKNQKQLKDELAGARSIAAWNASKHGLAIKVSEDGPISLYQKNLLVAEYG